MDLRQLEYFVAVAEEQNFTRAAERVHISQSGVSAQIRQLERELGAELFDRSARTATLTDAGKAALEHARAALAAAGAVGQAVDEVTGLIRGRLAVGMVIGCTVTPLFDALAAFHQAHPRVEISLLEDGSDRLIERGARRHHRCGSHRDRDRHPRRAGRADNHQRAARRSRSGRHPLAERRVTLRDLVAHPIVCMPPGTGLRTVFDQACAAHNLHPAIALQASAADAIADLAARGLGVAVLSNSMAASYRDRLTARTIDDVETPALLALIWKSTHGPAVRELLAHGRRAFTEPDAM